MLFRSKKKRGGAVGVVESRSKPAVVDSDGAERLIQEIGDLSHRNRERRDPELERRILQLRHEAALQLIERPQPSASHPEPAFELPTEDPDLPEAAPGELTPEVLRAAILRSGSLIVRGLIGTAEIERLIEGIDRAFKAREAQQSGKPGDGTYYAEFNPDPRFNLAAQRAWVASDAGGLWGPDSPRVMFDVLEAFERAGLRDLAMQYLGEPPAISVNKCTLRRVQPGAGGGHDLWHQDGAFLGDEVRALNVWLSLSRCGDIAPGLDIVPRRIDHIVPTGTEGATFDWSASRTVAEEAAGNAAILRPIFEPGDVLLFDELCLHSTAAEPQMPNMRHAVECWFFGPSGFPDDYAPLAV